MEKMRLKIRKIRKYAIDSVAWYHYVVGSIVTLVVILIALLLHLNALARELFVCCFMRISVV